MLPQLRQLEERFAHEIQVLGIHSPKFTAERSTEALRAAVARLGLTHPVANDASYRIWQAYGIRAWPTLVFIDPLGAVVGVHEGEFPLPAMEQTLEEMLTAFAQRGLLRCGPALRLEREPPDPSRLRFPGKVVALPGDGMAVSDSGHHRLVLLGAEGTVRAVVGGPEAGLRDGSAERARFRDPQGLAVLGGALLVADRGNHCLRRVDLGSLEVTTVAGNGVQGDVWNSPWDVAPWEDGVLVAMAGNHTIVRWSPARPAGEVFVGSGREALRDGVAYGADFAQPSGIVVQNGWAFVADSESSAIRALELATRSVRTLVGQGLFEFGDIDGEGSQVRLQHPLGLAALDEERLLVADTYNHRIKTLHIRSAQVRALAGAGRPGYADGVGTDALFSEPGGLTCVPDRAVIADTNNHTLRWVDLRSREVGTLALHVPGRALPHD